MRDFWQRYKFHLSGLMMLVPLPFLPEYLTDKPIFEPAEIHRPVKAGPYEMVLVSHDEPPHLEPTGEMSMEFHLQIAGTDIDSIRATFLRVDKPRNLRVAGALGFGNPYERGFEVLMPPQLSGQEELWLSVESWDGTVHQTSLPLSDMMVTRK